MRAERFRIDEVKRFLAVGIVSGDLGLVSVHALQQ
jgi:hypothetical protein